MADNNDADNSRIKLNSSDASFSDEVLKLAQCLMPEPPTAKVKRIVADSRIDRQLHEIGWKAYDTVVGAANNATNRLYSSPAVGNLLGGAIDIMLRWQRFNAAVAGAFFAALWPAVGLPSAAEVEALRRDLRSMREEVRDAVAERDSKDDFARGLDEAIRESIVSQRGEGKIAFREPDGAPASSGAEKPPVTSARKSSVYQFSVWSGWPAAEPTERGEDVGH
jgi:hypothetical protein